MSSPAASLRPMMWVLAVLSAALLVLEQGRR
jgi:hypothetical protein